MKEYGYAHQWISSAKLDPTHFILVGSIGSSGKAIIGTISGNTITFGSPYEFDPDYNGSYFAVALSDSRFVVVYNDGNYFYSDGVAIIGNIDGGVISYSDKHVFCTDMAAYFKITNLDTNSFVITYPKYDSIEMGVACIGTVSGNVISFGDKYDFGQVSNFFSHPLRLDAERFLVTSNNFYDTVAHGSTHIGTVIGDSISYSPSYWFCSMNCFSISSALMDDNKIVVAYSDYANDTNFYYGRVSIGTYYDNEIETFIDSVDVCSGSLKIPVRVNHLFNATESFIQLSYDTLLLSYNGYQNFSTSIPADSMYIDENDGIINIYWHTETAVNISSDTLVDLLFNSINIYNQTGTILTFNDTVSYYLDSTGLALESIYYSNIIEIDPIPEPVVFITGADGVCQGTTNVVYAVNSVLNATSYVWNLTPDSAGIIIGSDATVSIDFSTSYYGQATLSVYGSNECGNGDSAYLNINIIAYPTSIAGSDTTICENASCTLNGAANNYDHVYWATLGDGVYDDPFLLNSTYTPGNEDINNGNVNLIMFAYAISPCMGEVGDTLNLTISNLPEVDAGDDDSICAGNSYLLVGAADYYSSVNWTTSGDGAFDDTTQLSTYYIPGPNDIDNGNVDLMLIASPLSPCLETVSDTILISILTPPYQTNTPQGPVFINLDNTLSSEYFILTVENTTSYQWYIEPFEAGIIDGIDTNAIVNWNESYVGLVSYIYAMAINECGQTYSDSLIVDISPVGLPFHNKNPEITISPNPSKGIFNISIKGSDDYANLSVINSNGVNIKHKRISISENKSLYKLDLSDKSPGIYYIRIVLGSKETTEKLLLSR